MARVGYMTGMHGSRAKTGKRKERLGHVNLLDVSCLQAVFKSIDKMATKCQAIVPNNSFHLRP